MRKIQFIGDEQVVLSLQGLRSIKKVDTSWTTTEERYTLEWEYKGSKGHMSYKDQAKRDDFYNKIKEALTKEVENEQL
jgi:hypothetical protein